MIYLLFEYKYVKRTIIQYFIEYFSLKECFINRNKNKSQIPLFHNTFLNLDFQTYVMLLY